MHSLLRKKSTIFLMVFPGLLLFIFAVFFAIVLSFYYGMTNWSGIGSFSMVGLKNFRNILTRDPAFWQSLKNAFTLACGLVFIQHPLGLLLAIVLDEIGGTSEKVFRTIAFVPCVISVMVTSQMWLNIYHPNYGLLNKILDLLHLGFLKQMWLGDPKIVVGSLVATLVWQGLGWPIMYYYAGLKGLPEEMYEAAKVDGCNVLQRHLKLTVPLMVPIIKVNLTMAVIAALKQMEMVFLMTGGGPGNASQFLANFLYQKAFESFEYGYGNAIAALFVIICVGATVLLNKISSMWKIYD